MSGRKLLLDSNIVIYLSKMELDLSSFAEENDSLSISVITYMEVMGFNFQEEEESVFVEQFFDIATNLSLNDEIVQKVIAIRKNHRIKLPDAIIAATAMHHGCIIITRNVNDFSGISPQLIIENPISL